QSIYRFRRADIRVYDAIKHQLEQRGVPSLHLKTSFRSVPSVQRFVNGAFAPVMTGAAVHQPDYVPLMPSRAEVKDQPPVVVIAAPKPYGGNDDIAKSAIRNSLPDATVAFIQWLIDKSGWTVEENGKRVKIESHHICLLFRKYTESYAGDLTRPYVSALEARDIPHVVVGGRSLHGREEVETLRAALAAIEYPDDDLSLYATLRGSLFAFADTDLFAYQRSHRLDYTRIPETVEPRFAEIREAMSFLRSLHRGRNARPVADTLTRLIEHTRSFANFVFRPSGEQVLANVLLVEEYARAYDLSGGVSFRGFVQQLERDAERSQAKEAPTLEEGSTGVRMMTVHKAKGLEFPVVILADFCAGSPERPREYFDGERELAALTLAECTPRELRDNELIAQREGQAEEARLAYVAATRARDLLVVTALGEGPHETGWLATLSPAIYPAPDQEPTAPQPSYSAKFARETTLARPDRIVMPSVRPGQYEFASEHGAYDVVWWDPRAFEKAEPKFGVRQKEVLTEDPAKDSNAEVAAFREWEARRVEAVAQGSVPQRSVSRATEVARASTNDVFDVMIVELPREAPRPAGARFGTFVHALMAAIPLDANRDTIEKYARLCARVLGATTEDAEAAVEAVEAALKYKLLRRAADAELRGECRREVPVTLTRDDGTLIEGIVDLAFAEGGKWFVVDFKTNADLTGEEEVYERQVALYAEAVAKSTGLKCSAIILRI
ncbi:MAG TPA: 3'-5' exonuclease, partial [Thermoanaerobaculia bacterium]